MSDSRSLSAPQRFVPQGPKTPDEALGETELQMACALTFALRAREPYLQIVEHCTRVVMLVEWLARQLELDEEDAAVLRSAARLHEIGMLAVPPELVLKPERLAPEELERIRAQAWIGAEIVRSTQDPLIARLIEHQYSDYADLRRRFPEGSRELALGGILRVADVFDAMSHPRPYQIAFDPGRCLEVLRDGLGTKFHPDAVDTLAQREGHAPQAAGRGL